MNFSTMVVFMFVFLGLFALLVSTLPTEFLEAGIDYGGSEYQTDKEAAEMFSMANITAYCSTKTGTLEYGTSPDLDLGLTSGHYIELWWNMEYGRKMFEIRHIWPGLFGWWTSFERLIIQEPYKTQAGLGDIPRPVGIEKEHYLNLEENVGIANVSYSEWAISGYRVQIFLEKYNGTISYADSWDFGKMNYTIGYEYDWNQTNLNSFNLLGQILLFQSPNLGLGTGLVNTVVNGLVALPFWIMIAICVVKLVLAVIPFIKGTLE